MAIVCAVRRASLEIATSSWRRNYGYPGLFDVVSRARVLQNLTLTQQVFVDLWEVRLRPGKKAQDLVGVFGIEAATPVAPRSSGDLVVVRAPFHGFLKRLYFEYGVSFTPPLDFAPESIRLTLVGTDAAMARSFAYLRRTGIGFKTLSAGPYAGIGPRALHLLTSRQREVLEAAFRAGFYEIPSKITARQLAKKLGTSHQAVLSALHRAERRLIGAAVREGPSYEGDK